jgi:hypothetical protein
MNMNMNNVGNKLMNRFFRRVDGVVWDLMSGRIGVKTRDGIATLEGEGDNAQININMFDQFGFELPAFAQNTPTAGINVGDVIYGENSVKGWVVEKKEKSLVLMKPDGSRGSITPPKVQMMGAEGGLMVLRSLTSMLPGGDGGLNQMQSMLMPMLMMGEDSVDLDKIMPLMLMSQMGMGGATTSDGSNPMANMMPMIMMMGMLGGGKDSGKGILGGKKNFFDNP